MRFSTSLVLTTFLARHGITEGLGRFSYDDDDDRRPSKWDKVSDSGDNEWRKFDGLNSKTKHNECGKNDNKQSPVDLKKNDDCRADHEMLFSDGTCTFDDIIFEITPYSLKGTFPLDKCKPPGLDLSDSFHERYVNTFELKLPGEHTIKGESYDGELQFSNVINVEKEHKGNRDHQIAMVARLIDATKKKKDDYMEKFLEKWEAVADKKSRTCQSLGRGELNLAQIQRRQLREQKLTVPFISKKKTDILRQPFKNQYYYGYKGSLTIPPCSDVVLWYIVDNPMSISKEQLKRLQLLITEYLDDDCEKTTYASKSGAVNRPLQETKRHEIFHCDESDYHN